MKLLFKKIILFSLIILLNISLIFPQQIIKYNKKNKKDSKLYKEGEIIVKFKDSTNNSTIDKINKNYNTSIKKKSKKIKNLNVLKIDKEESINNIINKYKNDPNVEFVQPNYIYTINSTTPNDTYFNYQWGLKNTGQQIPPENDTGTNDCDIDASELATTDAWDDNTGDSNIIVAVIDTGIDYLHPDLSNNLWTDGSGNYGYDFIDYDTDPMDLNGHGSIVAGIIGATSNNFEGISGVAWNLRIMAIRGLDENGYGTSLTLSNSINYAVANGADIINASWGATIDDSLVRNAIQNAQTNNILFVAAAGNGGQDEIGDDNDTNSYYPANYHLGPYNFDNVISVAASDYNDNLGSFSNYGDTSVHVCAPGLNIISTIPYFSYVMSDFNKNIYIYSLFGFILFFPALFFKTKKKYLFKKILFILLILLILLLTIKCQPPFQEKSSDSSSSNSSSQKVVTGHGYAIAYGTSAAAPFISGIAVLMKTKNDTLTPAEIITILSDSANSEDGSGTLSSKVISGGRINAKLVLDAVAIP